MPSEILLIAGTITVTCLVVLAFTIGYRIGHARAIEHAYEMVDNLTELRAMLEEARPVEGARQ